jgi:hypothetical protein
VPYPGSFILQVSAVVDPSLLQISGAPGVVHIFNLTQQVQNSFFMADVRYTSDFDNLMVARVLPSYDHQYFSLRQCVFVSPALALLFTDTNVMGLICVDMVYLAMKQVCLSGEPVIDDSCTMSRSIAVESIRSGYTPHKNRFRLFQTLPRTSLSSCTELNWPTFASLSNPARFTALPSLHAPLVTMRISVWPCITATNGIQFLVSLDPATAFPPSSQTAES